MTQVANVEGDAPEAEVCGSVAEPLQAFAYEYDGRGNRTKETWTSGLNSEETTYAYDLADRLTGVAYPSGPTVLYDLAADETRLGEKHLSSGPPNLSFETTAGLTKHLEYVNNTAGQLGEIRDGLTQATVATLGYDAAGRTTSWAQNGQTRTFTWDVEDRLRGVDWSGGASARYDYDHSGMRLSATTGGLTTRFVWGAGELLEEQAPGGTVHRYLREGELVVGVSDERLLHDALGTIVGRRSAAGVVASHRFDAWGNYNASTAPPSGEAPTIGYTGHHVDTIAGLTYAKARWYAPELGWFLSTDPIGVTDSRLLSPVGLNTFLYANSNPLGFVDLLGLEPSCIGQEGCDLSIFQKIQRSKECGLTEDGWRFGGGSLRASDLAACHAKFDRLAEKRFEEAQAPSAIRKMLTVSDDWTRQKASRLGRKAGDVIGATPWVGDGVRWTSETREKTETAVDQLVCVSGPGATNPDCLERSKGLGRSVTTGIDWSTAALGLFRSVGRVIGVDTVNATGRIGRLRSIGPDTWESSGGLIYGPDMRFGNRVAHVIAHARPNDNKPSHTVFSVRSGDVPGLIDEVVGLIDEAWSMRRTPVADDPGAFMVPMGRVVGTRGETVIRIVVLPDANEIITAYPVAK